VLVVLALEVVRAETVRVSVDGRPWLRSAGGEAEYEPHHITLH
jgi:hypothetical protein